ncbi:unnamed protein product [Lepeophtheirus salmonis]|uniref:(salmon louse) hypothetical protein n=1 Tax=Lepeophtheirus salmonis TaxID=72036 RepID=A0A7R8H0Y3_LEPSM|nr:unnamed protein product [Lepeophtheirus salmonis]CAF2799724.1 unnamed protein product [Lepeophtheirus salmonis]
MAEPLDLEKHFISTSEVGNKIMNSRYVRAQKIQHYTNGRTDFTKTVELQMREEDMVKEQIRCVTNKTDGQKSSTSEVEQGPREEESTVIKVDGQTAQSYP